MIALLLATTLLRAEPQTFRLEPSDDIWVYPHASDPSKDPYLRVWGAEGKAVAPSPEESEEFSYSYLKFDLKTLPKGMITGAKLTLTSIADPGYTSDYIKDNPLQVRALRTDFSEKTWEYDIVHTLNPDKDDKAVYGSASPKDWPAGKPFPLVIDLLKGPADFKKDLSAARDSAEHLLGLALTSTDDVQTMGSTAVYKLYSKDADKKELHPVLEITIDPAK